MSEGVKRSLPVLKNQFQYRDWKTKMKLHFQGSSSWDIVDGSEKRPGASHKEERKKFDQKAARAFFDLLTAVKGDFGSEIGTYGSVSEAWAALEASCGVTNEVEIQKCEELLETFTSRGSVQESIAAFTAIVNRLENAGGKISSTQKTLKLLKVLPESYDNWILEIRTSTAVRKEDKSYDFDKIVQRLKKRAVLTDSRSKIRQKSKNPGSSSSTKPDSEKVLKVRCYNCNSDKHLKKDCPCCNYCKEEGHKIQACPKRPKKKKDKAVSKVVRTSSFKSLQLKIQFTTQLCLRLNQVQFRAANGF